jgi:hypothetical protein
VTAIHAGEVASLKRLLHEHPGSGRAWLIETGESCGGQQRSWLHVATDWPGHFPNVARTIEVLVGAGSDVNARFAGPNTETPLHWAASSNDLDALDALLDAGAEIDADNGVIGNGTPLTDAVAFGQWEAARRLLQRGATARLWEAAALGLQDVVAAALDAQPAPDRQALTEALWSACHGGQRAIAALLLDRGGDLNWIGWSGNTPLDVAIDGEHHELAQWLIQRGARRGPSAS